MNVFYVLVDYSSLFSDLLFSGAKSHICFNYVVGQFIYSSFVCDLRAFFCKFNLLQVRLCVVGMCFVSLIYY